MKTRVVLTVDTEPSIAGAFEENSNFAPLIHEPVAGMVDGKSEALGFMLSTLCKNQLVATFFVETVHTAYFKDSPMEQYAVQLTEAGQDVQLHLHPCWRNFNGYPIDANNLETDNCSEIETAELTRLLSDGANRLKSWTGTRATSMRPGNYSTGRNLFSAMSAAGISYSSCINIAAAAPAESELQITYGKHCFSGVTELPVTCFRDKGPIGRNRWRPLQITALSAVELISLLNKANSAGHASVVIVTHPFEFLKRDNPQFENLRANRLVQRRFERLCGFLNKNRDRFDVAPLSDAASIQGQAPSTVKDLTGNALQSVSRAVVNFSNDRF